MESNQSTLPLCVVDSVGKLPLDKALDLTLYLSKETEIMPVTQGFSELVPLYKLMEKRDMVELENQMKVSDWEVMILEASSFDQLHFRWNLLLKCKSCLVQSQCCQRKSF